MHCTLVYRTLVAQGALRSEPPVQQQSKQQTGPSVYKSFEDQMEWASEFRFGK
jgi:hypothetical protein